MLRNRMAEELRRMADALEQSSPSDGGVLVPHNDTRDILALAGLKREQFSFSTPDVLRLRDRVRRCASDNRLPRGGHLVALIMDTGLRSLGYPPPSDLVNGVLRRTGSDPERAR